MLNYLFAHFHERAEITSQLEAHPEHLENLIQAQCAPNPSYRVIAASECLSYFGEHTEQTELQFFAKGQLSWMNDLNDERIVQTHIARDLFNARYNSALHQLAQSSLADHVLALSGAPMSAPSEAKRLATWQYFLDGTYGVCTIDGLPQSIAVKQTLVSTIDQFIQRQPTNIPKNQIDSLAQLLTALDRVEALFAPHERAKSSRQRCIVEVRAKYLTP